MYGILLVYDVSDEQSFNDIRNLWMEQIQKHASDDVTKVWRKTHNSYYGK